MPIQQQQRPAHIVQFSDITAEDLRAASISFVEQAAMTVAERRAFFSEFWDKHTNIDLPCDIRFVSSHSAFGGGRKRPDYQVNLEVPPLSEADIMKLTLRGHTVIEAFYGQYLSI